MADKFQIKHHFTGAVLFERELGAELRDASRAIRLGAAVKLALNAGADLSYANLPGACLAGACLAGSNLTGIDLSYANLSSTDLSSTDLSYTNLDRADLSGANLDRANLSSAYLAGAYLAGVYHVIAAGQPNGFWAFGYLRDNSIRVRIGCRDKSLTEARQYWSEVHPNWDAREEIPAALDMIEAIARLRGWKIKAEATDA